MGSGGAVEGFEGAIKVSDLAVYGFGETLDGPVKEMDSSGGTVEGSEGRMSCRWWCRGL